MTMTMGMEDATRLSTVEAITEMGTAITALEEQLQHLLLLEGVQLHQPLLLAKPCCEAHYDAPSISFFLAMLMLRDKLQ